MTSHVTRRSLVAFGAGMATLAIARPAITAALGMPVGKTMLTITGKITNVNSNNAAIFDRAMLEALGLSSIETMTPWYNNMVKFEGVRMDTLMRHVGATGSSIIATALNDFSSEIPISDFDQYGVLLALKRDGNYMPVRDKGPLFIVYPYDSSPELQAQKFYSRSAWQLAQMVVT